MRNSESRKNRLVALMLSCFLGMLGADRFYLGKSRSALIKAMTLGGVGVWWFLDFSMLLIDSLLYSLGKDTGMVKDAANNELKYGLSGYRYIGGKWVKDWRAS